MASNMLKLREAEVNQSMDKHQPEEFYKILLDEEAHKKANQEIETAILQKIEALQDKAMRLDPCYRELMEECRDAEAAFLGMQNQFTREQMDSIWAYLFSCESVSWRLLYLSYLFDRFGE